MKRLLYGLVLIVLFASCKKENEKLNVVATAQICPLAVGKVFFYKMDSTITINFGSSLATHSYHAKDSIESTFLDITGRTSFRIFRYVRDTADTQDWKFIATNYATVTNDRVEYIENNLRYITIASPISANTYWKGNAYINTSQGTSQYDYLDGWDFQYQNLDAPFTCLKGTIQNTYTVLQQDATSPAIFDPSIRDDKNYSIEVYAEGIGLIYKEFLHYTWQPTPQQRYEDASWGIKLNLIDYK